MSPTKRHPHLAMGQNPIPPVNIPIPTRKDQNGWCTYPNIPKMGSQNGFDNHSHSIATLGPRPRAQESRCRPPPALLARRYRSRWVPASLRSQSTSNSFPVGVPVKTTKKMANSGYSRKRIHKQMNGVCVCVCVCAEGNSLETRETGLSYLIRRSNMEKPRSIGHSVMFITKD